MKPQPLLSRLVDFRAYRPMVVGPLVLAAMLLAGCQGGADSAHSSQPDTAVVASRPGRSAPNSTGAGQAKTPPPNDGGPPPTLPAAFQTDGYHWYGLANEKPVSFEVALSGTPGYSGTQTVHLKSVGKGQAIYEIERTGGLADQLGTDTVSLDKKGIYITKSTMYKAIRPILDLPSTVAIGTTWRNQGKLEMTSGQQFTQNMNFKVVREEKVTTPVGSETALLISATGSVQIDSKKFRMESDQWYVKDRGLVKSVIRMFALAHPKEKPQVITIQETKS